MARVPDPMMILVNSLPTSPRLARRRNGEALGKANTARGKAAGSATEDVEGAVGIDSG